jgi:hypothetical protein
VLGLAAQQGLVHLLQRLLAMPQQPTQEHLAMPATAATLHSAHSWLRLVAGITTAARLPTQQLGAQASLRRLEQRKPFLLVPQPPHHSLTTHTHSSKQEHLALGPSRSAAPQPLTMSAPLERLAHAAQQGCSVLVGTLPV